MELRHLRYFVTLAEELHFSRAAERLGISPPTLTIQIQEIERALSAKLFARTKRSVALTPAGEIFLVEARHVLAQFARAENVGRRAGRGEIGRIEIGYVGGAAYSGVLQGQTAQFRSAWPEVELKARELPIGDVVARVKDGQIDVGFIRLPVALPSGLQSHLLLRDRYCVALPATHPEGAGAEPIRPEGLASEAFITPEQAAGTHEFARRGKFRPEIVADPGSLSLVAVLAQVSLGMGVAIVPSVAAAVVQFPNVIFRPIDGEPIPAEVAAVFRNNELSGPVKKFIEQVRRSPPDELAFRLAP
jgi:DNA-binding transcriptional LysR family regulator